MLLSTGGSIVSMHGMQMNALWLQQSHAASATTV